MAGAALRGRLDWRIAEIVQTIDETPRTRSLVLAVPDWPGHAPGQHVDVRLTAPDGYQTERSYSIASAPDGERVEITVERLDDGEVSPYLAEELGAGDQLEMRGPIGGYFTWTVADGGPLMLIAGGSGVVPLMAMIRTRTAAASDVPTRLLYSSRTFDDIIYRDELERLSAADSSLGVIHTLTRERTAEWRGLRRRIDRAMMKEVAWRPDRQPRCYVCGPTPFVENAASILTDLGHAPERILTERFGPTGA